MRAVGEFKEEEKANTFSAFLHAEGIDNEAEGEDGIWTIWVQDEECLGRAIRELDRFRENPHRPEYLKATQTAEKDPKPEREDRLFRGRYKQVDLGKKWRGRTRAGHVTMALMAMSVFVFLLTGMGKSPMNVWRQNLSITEFEVVGETIRWISGVPEISSWQLWRLFTPALIHFGFIHFLFNMMWLFDLGGMIESRKGAWFFVFFVLLAGIVSNTGQYLVGGPAFGGMSGVVYALFGFAWIKGRFDPGDGIGVPQTTIVIMVGWFLLCFTPFLQLFGVHAANTAHAIGLGIGAGWGYLSAIKWRR